VGIAAPEEAQAVADDLAAAGEMSWVLGEIVEGEGVDFE
jgi:hypothetical protein